MADNIKSTGNFKCSRCGACCRLKQCKHLTKDSLCAVHDNLPDDCSVDKAYITFGASKEITIEEWYKEEKALCRFLQMREAHRRPL